MRALYEPAGDDGMTFAEPGDGRTFLEDIAAPGDLLHAIRAAERSMLTVENTYAREAAIEEAAERRVRDVQAATGVQLKNYARVPPTLSTMHGLIAEPEGGNAREEFHARLIEVAEQFPEHAAAIRAGVTIEDDARGIAVAAEHARDDAMKEISGAGRVVAAIAGGIKGGLQDPLMLSTMLAGGGAGTAATVIGRLGQVALREALYNAGAIALAQPRVQAWREEAGLRSGVVPAIENIGFAALMGGMIGSGIQGVREVARPAREALGRLLSGQPSPGDVQTAAKALEVRLDPETARTVAAAERELAADALMRSDRPDEILLPPPAESGDELLRARGFGEEDIAAMDPERRAAEIESAREAEAIERFELEAELDDLGARAVRWEQGMDDPLLDPTYQMIERVMRGEVEGRLELPRSLGAAAADEPPPARMPPLPEGAHIAGESRLGPVIEGLQGRWQQALDWLRAARRGDALGVLEHPDVPGRIDVVWGNKEYGIAHILARGRGHLLPDFPERLAKMKPDNMPEARENRIRLTDGEVVAVIRTDMDGAEKNWVLTAFEQTRRGGDSTESSASLPEPARSPVPPGETNIGRAAGEGNDGSSDPLFAAAEAADKKDVLDLVPLERDDGSPVFVPREAAARAGERDGFLGELLRGCKT